MLVCARSVLAPDVPPWDFNIPLDPKSLGYIALFAIGYAYHISDLRKGLYLRQHWNRTDGFIRDQLISFLDDDLRSRAAHLNKSSVMNVFWNLVDNDNTLTLRSQEIRRNGTFVSSVVDVAFFSLLIATYHLALFFFSSDKLGHLIWMLASGTLSMVAELVLLPWLLNRHVALQDGQLEYVKAQKRSELSAQLEKAL